MNQVSTTKQRRPGGRTAQVSGRIHRATIDILLEDGADACTFTEVAERAQLKRSTLYRRYGDRWDMIIEAFIARAAADVMPDLAGSFPEDLATVLRRLRDTLVSPLGPALMKVAGEFRDRSGSDYSRAYFDARMIQLAPMFEAAIARGELRQQVAREELFTFAAGPIYFRIFIAARGVDNDFIDFIVSQVCWLYCEPSVIAKLALPARLA